MPSAAASSKASCGRPTVGVLFTRGLHFLIACTLDARVSAARCPLISRLAPVMGDDDQAPSTTPEQVPNPPSASAPGTATEPAAAADEGDEDTGVPEGFWEESEILAIITEVHARRSVDTLKLFGGGSAELGERLSRRSPGEVKMLINRCKGSFDAHAAPWVPKCGVPELLAVLASEAAFCRNQRLRRASGLQRLAADKLERARMEAARRDGKRDAAELVAFVKEEEAARVAAEEDKQVQGDAFTEAKKELDEEKDRGEAAEDVLQVARLRELEARRKLDRARIRVAALRGEFVTPTVREFVRPSLASVRAQDVPTAEEVADAMAAPTPLDSDDVVFGKRKSLRGADSSRMKEAGDDSLNYAFNVEDDPVVSWEEAEGKEAMELRLLRNRLSMHMSEAAEWHAAAASERNRARLLQASRSRLEREVSMPGSVPGQAPHAVSGSDGLPGSGGTRLPPKAKGKRPVSATHLGMEREEFQNSAKDDLSRKRRRKGVPVRSLLVLPI